MSDEATNIPITGAALTEVNNFPQGNSSQDLQSSTLPQNHNILPDALHDSVGRRLVLAVTQEAMAVAKRINSRINASISEDGYPIVLVTGSERDQLLCTWIAHDVPTTCRQNGQLAASFFYQPIERDRVYVWSHGEAQKIYPTLAYQFATSYPNERQFTDIRDLVAPSASIVNESVSTQLQDLIVEPPCSVTLTKPFVIVIDGLNTCPPKELKHWILDMLRTTNIRFVITSRPTSWIRKALVTNETSFFEERLQDERRPRPTLRQVASRMSLDNEAWGACCCSGFFKSS